MSVSTLKRGPKQGAKYESTNQRKEGFLRCLEHNLALVRLTRQMCQVPRQTYYSWLRRDSEFKQRVEDIKLDALDLAEMKLFEKIQEGDLNSIMFYLKTQGKHKGYSKT